MDPSQGFRLSDPATVARYLQLRAHLYDDVLSSLETQIEKHYEVKPTRRIAPTLVALVRLGFTRAGEGELWPVVFLSAVDVSLALLIQFTPERLASLGTVLNGPQRSRHRQWEDWWGWETSLSAVHPRFFEISPPEQDEAIMTWYHDRLEWLTHNGLLLRK